MSFKVLGLLPELLQAITYKEPSPIQKQAIPIVLKGLDLMAAAQTGTGKTAGFVLPVLQRLTLNNEEAKTRPNSPRALILTPTRELAAQVNESVLTYGEHLPLKSVVVFVGKAEFKTEKPQGVFAIAELIKYLQGHTEEVMSLNRVQFCVGRLETTRLAVTGQTDLAHVQSLERRHGPKKSN
jgi:ATP-dependent RNA helicase RhlE